MKIYLYDSKTFEYAGTREANIDPEVSKHLGRPIYVIPTNATKVEVPELKENETAIFNTEESAWEVISTDAEFELLSETAQQIQNRKNLLQYQLRASEIKEKYETYINTPVEYKGFSYLPKYGETYKALLNKAFPITIWDSKGINSKEVTASELADIAEYLDNICEKAYQVKMQSLKKCNQEIERLQGEI